MSYFPSQDNWSSNEENANPDYQSLFSTYGYHVVINYTIHLKAYISAMMKTKQFCSIQFRTINSTFLYASSFAINNPKYAVIHKTKSIPIDCHTYQPYLHCVPYLINRVRDHVYTLTSNKSFHNITYLYKTFVFSESKTDTTTQYVTISYKQSCHFCHHALHFSINSYNNQLCAKQKNLPYVTNQSTIVVEHDNECVLIATCYKQMIYYSWYDYIDALTAIAILQCLLFENILLLFFLC